MLKLTLLSNYWKKMYRSFMVFLLFLLSMSLAQSPIGTWKTIDDKTQKEKAIIEIYEEDQTLFGRIIASLANPETFDTSTCDMCPGEEKNMKIKDLKFIQDMVPIRSDTWGKGTILDPDNGKRYNAKMTLKKNGKELHVRGFIGISLFGRTQVWYRTE